MNRRNFVQAAAGGALVAAAAPAGSKMIGIQVGAVSFVDEGVEKVGHNLKYDLSVLKWHGLSVRGKLFDTMIAHSLIEPDMRHGMDYLSEVHLGYTPVPITKLIGDEKTEQIIISMQTGAKFGMQTMNMALHDLYARHLISFQEALDASTDPDDLKRIMQRGSTMERV